MRTEITDHRSEVRGQESAVGMPVSVLECGGGPLLPSSGKHHDISQSARGLAHFKTWRMGFALGGLLSVFCVGAQAQNYSIDWHTIDGGGGTSTGAVYSVSGTIGQPDAATMSGGSFTLTGGFWALPVAVQVTNAPTLFITSAAPGVATISWDPPTPGFILQASPVLTPPAWTNAPSGATNPVTVPTALPTTFYRLHRP